MAKPKLFGQPNTPAVAPCIWKPLVLRPCETIGNHSLRRWGGHMMSLLCIISGVHLIMNWKCHPLLQPSCMWPAGDDLDHRQAIRKGSNLGEGPKPPGSLLPTWRSLKRPDSSSSQPSPAQPSASRKSQQTACGFLQSQLASTWWKAEVDTPVLGTEPAWEWWSALRRAGLGTSPHPIGVSLRASSGGISHFCPFVVDPGNQEKIGDGQVHRLYYWGLGLDCLHLFPQRLPISQFTEFYDRPSSRDRMVLNKCFSGWPVHCTYWYSTVC